MKTQVFRKIGLFLFSALLFAGCKDDDSDFVGKDNRIVSFRLSVGETVYKGVITDDEIRLTVPANADLTGAKAVIEVCENVRLTPDPATITDWGQEYQFIATSYNNTDKVYRYTILRTDIVGKGNTVLNTQAEVDAFAATDITVIDGNLILGAETGGEGFDSIRNLDGLAALKEVTYNITVNNTYAGTELKLENLEKTGGFRIGTSSTASKISDLETVSLPALREIGTEFVLNQLTAKIVDVPALTAVGESFTVKSDSLKLFSADRLEAVGGALSVWGTTSYTSKDEMESLSFPALKRVGGTIDIERFQQLETLEMPQLAFCGGFKLSQVKGLETVAVPMLENCSGEFSINLCDNITSVSCPVLRAAASVDVEKGVIGTLDLSSLTGVTGNFKLVGLSITDLTGLRSLTDVGGKLEMQDLYSVTSLTDMAALRSAGELSVYNLPLDEIDIRNLDVQKLSVYGECLLTSRIAGPDDFEGTLYINAASKKTVTSLPPVEGFKTIGGDLDLYQVSDVNTPIEFPNVISVGGKLNLSSASSLPALKMAALERVGGNLTITPGSNTELEFPALNSIGGYFSVSPGNNMQALELPALRTVGGYITVSLSSAKNLQSVKMPVLTGIGGPEATDANNGKLEISGTNWSKNTSVQTLDFDALTSAKKVTLSYMTSLTDFGTFRSVIPVLNNDTWKVTGCGYDPSWQDMKDGNTVKP